MKKHLPSTEIQLNFTPPDADEFIALRTTAGWSNPDLATIQHSINNSLFWVVIRRHEQLIATGRIVGDNAMYFYIQDVIVHPEFQGLGLGAQLMQQIENYLAKHTKTGATIGLLAAKDKEAFYQKFGYQLRNGEALGYGMCKFIG